MTPSDKALLERWTTRRDSEAFLALVERYAKMVFNTSRRILDNSSDAEDVTQECFETLVETVEAPRAAALGPWLHRVATNRALNRIRSERRRKRRETEFIEETRAHVEMQWNDVYDALDEAINALPEDLREPLVAHFLCGQSHRQIGRMSGVPSRTVSNRIKRGLTLIGEQLRGQGIAVPGAGLAVVFSSSVTEAVSLPMTLSVSLGQLAIASAASQTVGASGAGGIAAIAGGLLAMKKTSVIALIAGAIIVAAGVTWVLVPDRVREKPAGSEPAVRQAREATRESPTPEIPSREVSTAPVERAAVSGTREDAGSEFDKSPAEEVPDAGRAEPADKPDGKSADTGETDKAIVEAIFASMTAYFEAGLAGDAEAAARVCWPGASVAEQAPEVREIWSESEDVPFDVYATGETGLAVSSLVQSDSRNQPSMYLVFTFRRNESGAWLIADVDGEDFDGAEGEIERFLENEEDARLLWGGNS